MTWPCFWIEPVRSFVEYFTICQGESGGHRVVHEVKDGADFDEVTEPDVLWPERCPQCAARLDLSRERGDGSALRSRTGGKVYRRPDTGVERRDQHGHGPGAVFECGERAVNARPHNDGRRLGVILPPGGFADLWLIDTPASTGGFWTRTTVPDTSDLSSLTVTPSTLTPRYHSWLTGGVLGDSLTDRPLTAGLA